MKRDARFYFANLGADVSRCISASREGDDASYQDSIESAYDTLSYLIDRPEAYEEGLLLLSGLKHAQEANKLPEFQNSLDELMGEYSPLPQ